MPFPAMLAYILILTAKYHPDFIMKWMRFVHRWPCKAHENPKDCNKSLEFIVYSVVRILIVFETVWEVHFVGFRVYDAGRRRERERILGPRAGPLAPVRLLRMLKFCWVSIAVMLFLLKSPLETVWDGLLGSAPLRDLNWLEGTLEMEKGIDRSAYINLIFIKGIRICL